MIIMIWLTLHDLDNIFHAGYLETAEGHELDVWIEELTEDEKTEKYTHHLRFFDPETQTEVTHNFDLYDRLLTDVDVMRIKEYLKEKKITELKNIILKECKDRGFYVTEDELSVYDNYVEFANCDYRIGKHINGYSIYCSYYDVIKVWNENDEIVIELYLHREQTDNNEIEEKEYTTFNEIEEIILKKYFNS